MIGRRLVIGLLFTGSVFAHAAEAAKWKKDPSPETIVAGFEKRVDEYFKSEAGRPLVRQKKRPPLPGRSANYVRNYSNFMPLTCGACAALATGEVIAASTAVIFCKARGDRPELYRNQQEQRYDFSSKTDRHLFYDRVSHYAGWRFVNFGFFVNFGDADSAEISITVECDVACELEVRADEHDGQLLVRIDIAGGGTTKTYRAASVSKISEWHTVFPKLKAKADAGRMKVRDLKFQ